MAKKKKSLLRVTVTDKGGKNPETRYMDNLSTNVSGWGTSAGNMLRFVSRNKDGYSATVSKLNKKTNKFKKVKKIGW